MGALNSKLRHLLPTQHCGRLGAVSFLVLCLEVPLMLYSAAAALLAPAFWLSTVLPNAQTLAASAPPVLMEYYRHGGVATLALAGVLEFALLRAHKQPAVLESVLYGLFAGDVGQLIACSLIARAQGSLDPANGAYVGMTLVFAAARVGWLYDTWRHAARAGKSGKAQATGGAGGEAPADGSPAAAGFMLSGAQQVDESRLPLNRAAAST